MTRFNKSHRIGTGALAAFLVVLVGCEEPPGAGGDTGNDSGGGPDCPELVEPYASQLLDEDGLARIEALPYYASAVLDVPSGEERYGGTQLVVEPDGTRRVRVTTTNATLTATVFIDVDLTAALTADEQYMFAFATDDEAPLGSISVNGENGTFFQGGVSQAVFEAQPSGLFALAVVPTDLRPWPPQAQPDADVAEQMQLFGGTELRVLGRLHGSCMTELDEGLRARRTDFAADPACDDLIGHL